MSDLKRIALDGEVILWIFFNKTYDKLRSLKGCENLHNLETVSEDAFQIRRMAKSMGAFPWATNVF